MFSRFLLTRLCSRSALLLSLGLQCTMFSEATAADAGPRSSDNDIRIEVQRELADNNDVFHVQASMNVAATPRRCWQVMTDYDRLADFVPGFTLSRVISRDGNRAVVEQEGYVQFLFIKQRVKLLLSVQEQAYSRVDLTLLQGNMRQYETHWQLIPDDAGHTRILYTATLSPAFFVLPGIGTSLMKSDLYKMFNAVAVQIEQEDAPHDMVDAQTGVAQSAARQTENNK